MMYQYMAVIDRNIPPLIHSFMMRCPSPSIGMKPAMSAVNIAMAPYFPNPILIGAAVGSLAPHLPQ